MYRAITQSVTAGEALNYYRFYRPGVDGSARTFRWEQPCAQYVTGPNLNLAFPFDGAFAAASQPPGRRVLSLGGVPHRAPVVWQRPDVSVRNGLLTLNPMIVDAMSEARGYGMALACWMWALELLLESVESFSTQKLNLAGLCLGLSVAASLAFAAPAAALLAVYLVWSRGSGIPRIAARNLVLIALLTAFVLLVIPMNRRGVEDARLGATSCGKPSMNSRLYRWELHLRLLAQSLGSRLQWWLLPAWRQPSATGSGAMRRWSGWRGRR